MTEPADVVWARTHRTPQDDPRSGDAVQDGSGRVMGSSPSHRPTAEGGATTRPGNARSGTVRSRSGGAKCTIKSTLHLNPITGLSVSCDAFKHLLFRIR